jgi:hypothetical protein
VDYIFQVNQCEPIVVLVHTIQVFDPLTLKDVYLQSRVIIESPYVLYVPIVCGFHSYWINSLNTNAAILGNTPNQLEDVEERIQHWLLARSNLTKDDTPVYKKDRSCRN